MEGCGHHEALRRIIEPITCTFADKYDRSKETKGCVPIRSETYSLLSKYPIDRFMFKQFYTKVQSLWKPRAYPSSMSYPVQNFLEKQYKDPDKLEKTLNEVLGADGWGKIDASIPFIPHIVSEQPEHSI